MATEHYTAVLEVQRTVCTPPASVSSYSTRNPDNPTKGDLREVAEVARIVVRADSLDRLRDKLAAHVALID